MKSKLYENKICESLFFAIWFLAWPWLALSESVDTSLSVVTKISGKEETCTEKTPFLKGLGDINKAPVYGTDPAIKFVRAASKFSLKKSHNVIQSSKLLTWKGMPVGDRTITTPSRTDVRLAVNRKNKTKIAEIELRASDSVFQPGREDQSSSDSDLRLNVTYEGEKLQASPKSLMFNEISSAISFTFRDEERGVSLKDNVALFVRDNSIVSVEREQSKIIAQDKGKTELFVVYRDNMLIIPVFVGGDIVPSVMLSDGSEDSLQNALDDKLGDSDSLEDKNHSRRSHSQKSLMSPKKGYSLRSDETAAQLTNLRDQKETGKFLWKPSVLKKKAVTFQVVDERSFPEESTLFPVFGIQVRIVGAKYSAPTDIQGKVQFYDIPSYGRLLVKLNDPAGNYLPSEVEVPLDLDREDESVIIKVLSQKSFDLYQNVYSISQTSDKASLCGRFVSNSLDKDPQFFVGAEISLNLPSSGARYFNRFGPADSQHGTDPLGRFCFFNVQPGLAEVTVQKNAEYVTSFVTSLSAGFHAEEDIKLNAVDNPTIHLVGLPSSSNQVYGSRFDATRFSSVDFAQLVVVGSNRQMSFSEAGLVDNDGDILGVYKSRIYMLNQSPEFEPALYAVDDINAERDHIIPLLQRGFVEDLLLELGSTGDSSSPDFDSSLGSVVIYMPKSQNSKSELSIKLFNSDGGAVEGGWYFGEQDPLMAKAIFYNLERGNYQAVAEDLSGQWHSVSTIPIDYWTTSFLVIGGRVIKSDSDSN